MIDEKKLKKYIMTEINPYGKPFDGTGYEFGNMLMDYIERMEKEPEIVHCKDCKYWIRTRIGEEELNQCGLAGYLIGGRGYCLYGKAGEPG